MVTSSNSLAGTPSISAMDLRSNPGTILDRVDYRQESFVIERAGKAKAVLIPVSVYKKIEEAHQRVFTTNKQIARAFKKESPKKIVKEINKAIAEIRKDDAS